MVKILAKSLREYKKASWLTVILSVFEVVFEIIIPLCMSKLIDYGIAISSMHHVWIYGTALMIFAGMELVTGVMSAKLAAKASAGFAANLRSDMYDKVQTFAFSNIDKFSTASVVTRLTTDVTNLQNAYQMIIRMAIRGPVMMIFSVFVSFTISRQISMIFLAVIPILAVLLYLIIKRVYPIFNRVFATYDKLNNVVQEDVKGIRVVKSFDCEEKEAKKFNAISERIYHDFAKGEQLIALNFPLMQVCMYGCMIIISWLGAKAIIAGGNNAAMGLTTGELTALITYSMQILVSLMMLSMVFAMITIASSSAKRAAELINEKSDIISPSNAVTEVKNGDIDFSDVRFSYAAKTDKCVLSDINLHINSGEVIGIIGGTGSSKTSLVQLIPRLYDVTGGSVSVGGVDVRKYDLGSLRNEVSVVLQKSELFSGTIAENLRWGNPDASDDEIKEACRIACADEFIDAKPEGYNTYIEQGGTNVSGGQKQRLCIAAALLKKPKILILDDSTSAVDTQTDAYIRKALSEYMPRTTKIIIAQRISSVENADRIIVLDDGKISEIGTHKELIKTSAIYREVYESQQKGGIQNEQKKFVG